MAFNPALAPVGSNLVSGVESPGGYPNSVYPADKPEGDENEFALGEQKAQKPRILLPDGYVERTNQEDASTRQVAFDMAIKASGGQLIDKIEAQALRNLAFLKTGKFEAE